MESPERAAGSVISFDRVSDRGEVFLGRLAHRSGARMQAGGEQTKILHSFFRTIRDKFGAMPFACFEIPQSKLGHHGRYACARCDSGRMCVA